MPLATVAFAFVANFPIFQDFLKVLETFLLRHLLPSSASAIVREYVVVLAEGAAAVIGPSIIFVAITGVLVVDNIESEINEIWGIRKKRPIARRVLVYFAGITAGPVMVGAAISLIRWAIAEFVSAVPQQKALTEILLHGVPTALVVIGLSVLYRIAPARPVLWRYAIASGVLAGIAFEVTKRVFTWYLTHFPSYQVIYGALAAFPALLVWIYLCWLIVLAGAAVTATLEEAFEAAGRDNLALPNRDRQATFHAFQAKESHLVWSLIQAAGWPIWPLIFASIIALALIFERLWSLRQSVVAPAGMVDRVLAEFRQTGATPELLARTAAQGPLGRILAAGLANVKAPRPVMKEAIEEVGRVVTHDLERFLTTLGTIAAMSPLLGLFGTVVGMIEIFGSQSSTASNPIQLAQGISIALYNTAMGLIVAIPSMIFYRYFRGKVDALVVEMEQQAIKLVDFAHGERK